MKSNYTVSDATAYLIDIAIDAAGVVSERLGNGIESAAYYLIGHDKVAREGYIAAARAEAAYLNIVEEIGANKKKLERRLDGISEHSKLFRENFIRYEEILEHAKEGAKYYHCCKEDCERHIKNPRLLSNQSL